MNDEVHACFPLRGHPSNAVTSVMEAIPSQANLHLMSYFFRRPRVVLLLQVLLVAWFAGPAGAVEAEQTLKLNYGWNAVWLEVEPTDASGGSLTCDQVFRADGFRIDRIASQIGGIGTADFTSDPESLFNQGGWDVWASDPASGETASIAVRANHAYLVHVTTLDGAVQDGAAAGTLSLRGKVAWDRPAWNKGSFNLVGFGVQGDPTFSSMLAASGIVVDGPIGAAANVQRLNSATGAWEAVKGADLLESGRAYWINVPYTLSGNGWAGPVEMDFPGAVSGSLGFGSGPGSLEVVNPADAAAAPVLMSSRELTFSNLEKTGPAQHQVTLSRLAPAAADPAANELLFFALEAVPDALQWRVQAADFTLGWQATSLGAGASQSVTVGVLRNWTTGSYLREHLYRVSVSLEGGSTYRYLPVTATQANLPAEEDDSPTSPTTGLWSGQIVLNSVTSLATLGAPLQKTPSRLALQIYIHVDAAGQARLVPRSVLMQTKTASQEVDSSPVLVVDESRIPYYEGIQQRADGTKVGLRLETVSFDLPRDMSAAQLSPSLRSSVAQAQGVADPAAVSDADVTAYFSLDSRTSRPPDLPEIYHLSWPLEGQLGVGKTLGTSSAAPLTLDPFHRTNPFRHAFHPQHGVGYPISRRFSLTVEASPDPTLLTGTYQETTLGLARQDLVAEGTLSLRRVSPVATLK